MKTVVLFSVLILLIACYGKNPPVNTGKEGQTFPVFSMQLSDSLQYFNTGAVPAGKPSALFYFGPHCPYSRAQMQEIIDDMDRVKDINFYLVTNFPLQDMNNFIQEFGLSKYPNVKVGRDTSIFVSNYYEVTGVPFMAVYNKEKKLTKAFLGEVFSREILEASNQ